MKLTDKEIRFAVEELSRCISENEECFSLLTAGQKTSRRNLETVKIAVGKAESVMEFVDEVVKLANEIRTNEPDKWICPDEASLISGWTVKTLRKYAKAGMIRSRKVRNNVLYLKEDIANLKLRIIKKRNNDRHMREFERMKRLTQSGEKDKKE